MNLVKVIDGDFERIRRNFQKIDSLLYGPSSNPTFNSVNAKALTMAGANGIMVATNGAITATNTLDLGNAG
jgi:hypothetical protein